MRDIRARRTLPCFVCQLLQKTCVFRGLTCLRLHCAPCLHAPRRLPRARQVRTVTRVIRVINHTDRRIRCPVIAQRVLYVRSHLPCRIGQTVMRLTTRCPGCIYTISITKNSTRCIRHVSRFVRLCRQTRRLNLGAANRLCRAPRNYRPRLLPCLVQVNRNVRVPLRRPRLLQRVTTHKRYLRIYPAACLGANALRSVRRLHSIFSHYFSTKISVTVYASGTKLRGIHLPFRCRGLLARSIVNFSTLRTYRRTTFHRTFT